jgi:hypothetical protein
MPRVGFECTTSLFERAKTVHTLDRAATGIGSNDNNNLYFYALHQQLQEPITELA